MHRRRPRPDGPRGTDRGGRASRPQVSSTRFRAASNPAAGELLPVPLDDEGRGRSPCGRLLGHRADQSSRVAWGLCRHRRLGRQPCIRARAIDFSDSSAPTHQTVGEALHDGRCRERARRERVVLAIELDLVTPPQPPHDLQASSIFRSLATIAASPNSANPCRSPCAHGPGDAAVHTIDRGDLRPAPRLAREAA